MSDAFGVNRLSDWPGIRLTSPNCEKTRKAVVAK
jgi:hypothetical protein